ncbi:hypothetical protein D018_1367B, partial [Vibrio parahaemolyticus VP2007-007]
HKSTVHQTDTTRAYH